MGDMHGHGHMGGGGPMSDRGNQTMDRDMERCHCCQVTTPGV